MTENEAIKILGNTTLCSPLGQAAFRAIESIKELQQFREIGTVEECREAVEKQKTMKVNEVHVDEYYCPACGSENNCDYGKVHDKYCPMCGHAIYQEESEEE